MPKPGPKSYECLKKAWHSDSHHQIRTQVLQRINRIAIEIHQPGTVESIHWKKELPKVISKVEEALYSGARSREEYLREDNLKERVNEAIDTIIGRTEETDREIQGSKMLPCVEAVLTLTGLPAPSITKPQQRLLSTSPFSAENSPSTAPRYTNLGSNSFNEKSANSSESSQYRIENASSSDKIPMQLDLNLGNHMHNQVAAKGDQGYQLSQSAFVQLNSERPMLMMTTNPDQTGNNASSSQRPTSHALAYPNTSNLLFTRHELTRPDNVSPSASSQAHPTAIRSSFDSRAVFEQGDKLPSHRPHPRSHPFQDEN